MTEPQRRRPSSLTLLPDGEGEQLPPLSRWERGRGGGLGAEVTQRKTGMTPMQIFESSQIVHGISLRNLCAFTPLR